MRHFAAAEIDAALDFPSLIDALAEAIRGGFMRPSAITMRSSGRAKRRRRTLLMPAWTECGSGADFLGVKIVNVFPGNGARGLPAVQGSTCCSRASPARRSPRSTERG